MEVKIKYDVCKVELASGNTMLQDVVAEHNYFNTENEALLFYKGLDQKSWNWVHYQIKKIYYFEEDITKKGQL